MNHDEAELAAGLDAELSRHAFTAADRPAVDLPGFHIPGHRVSLQDRIQGAIATFGSGRKAAKALGIPESTLRAWRKGAKPRHDPAPKFKATGRSNPPPGSPFWMAWTGQGELVIKGVIRVSGDIRDRTIHPGRQIPRSIIRAALSAYQRGEDDLVGSILLRAIDSYYQPMKFETVERVYFE